MARQLFTLLAAALAAAALWPLAAVFHWFGVNVATLEQMGRTDPMGFRVFPAFLMFVRPTLAAAAALVIVSAAVRVMTSHPQRAFGILMRAAVAQGLLATAIAATGTPVNATLAHMLPMFADRRTPGALVAPGHFVALQEAAAAAILPWLFGIAVGSALLAALARQVMRVPQVPRVP